MASMSGKIQIPTIIAQIQNNLQHCAGVRNGQWAAVMDIQLGKLREP